MSWLTRSENGVPARLNAEGFEQFKKHARALCIDHKEVLMAKWRFNPREFLLVFRRNGWMSLKEMAQIIPAKSSVAKLAGVDWKKAIKRLEQGALDEDRGSMPPHLHPNWQVLSRKYQLSSSPVRVATFFSQVMVESDVLKAVVEYGNDRHYRTMYEVITEQECAEDYSNPKSVANRLDLNINRKTKAKYSLEEYKSIRPDQVKEKAASLGNTQAGDGPRFKGRGIIQLTGRSNYAGYGIDRGKDYTSDGRENLLASNAFEAVDSALKFWVSREYKKLNINRYADGDLSTSFSLATIAVNGGTTHFSARQAALAYLLLILGDAKIPSTMRNSIQRPPE